jgi:hypothetical protein
MKSRNLSSTVTPNSFAFDAQLLNRPFAHALIWESHRAWASLCRGEFQGVPGDLALSPKVPNAATSSLNSRVLTSADVSFVSDTATRLTLRDFALHEPAARRTEPIYAAVRSAYLDARKKFKKEWGVPAIATPVPTYWRFLPDLAATVKALRFYGLDPPTSSNLEEGPADQTHEQLLHVGPPKSMPSWIAEPELHANILERINRMYGPRAKVIMKTFFATPHDMQATHENYLLVAMTYKAACTRAEKTADDPTITPANRLRIEAQVNNDLGVACEALHRFGIERDPTTRLAIPHSYRSDAKSKKKEASRGSNEKQAKPNTNKPPAKQSDNASDNGRQADLDSLRDLFGQK